MKPLLRYRTLLAVTATAVVCAAATAGAAHMFTGGDIKDGSLNTRDLNGKIQRKLKAVPVRVPGSLPSKSFDATNASVTNTDDGVEFGPYADGGSSGGSVCSSKLDGEPLSNVKHLAYEARYTATGDTAGVGAPYLRVFLESDSHDAIFSPNTQPPDPDTAEGPFHTWVATAGVWRYDDDGGSGGQYGLTGAPFSTVVNDHGTETVSGICITTGFTSGSDLSALLRSWEINAKDYSFGQ
jgi:hypothetical protein